MSLLGFWSYVHADDELDMGRVAQLARDIVGHYEAITGETIELFLDHDDLEWGDRWRDRISETLANVLFFIPVITPRYFRRHECRNELEFFVNKASQFGIREMILPLLYIDVAELQESEPSDPLMRVIQDIQWHDWRSQRFADRESGDYRSAVNTVAEKIVGRVKSVEKVDVVAAAEQVEASSDEDELGTLDKIAALEDAMPRWVETLDGIRAEIERIGAIMEEGTRDMERGGRQGKAFAARLSVARRVATQLGDPVQRIETYGQRFATDLAKIDAGVRVMLEQGQKEARENPDNLPVFCEFIDSIRTLGMSSREGFGSVQHMIDASQGLESTSKDMRTPIRRLRTSLVAMMQAREITDAWLGIIDSFNIECPDPAQS